jgi:hypothetical protein
MSKQLPVTQPPHLLPRLSPLWLLPLMLKKQVQRLPKLLHSQLSNLAIASMQERHRKMKHTILAPYHSKSVTEALIHLTRERSFSNIATYKFLSISRCITSLT